MPDRSIVTSNGNLDPHALYRDHVETLSARAGAALDTQGYDAVVIHAGRVQRKSPFDDVEWPFVPVPMFTHWSPLVWPESAVVVTKREARQWAVESKSFWERPPTPDWALIRAGLATEVVHGLDPIKKSLPAGRIGFVGHEPDAAAALGLAPDAVNPPALVEALEDTRVEKTPYELWAMTEASRRGVLGHRAAAEAFAGGSRSELQIHLAYLRASGQDDADAPYKGIVALGTDAATLHHIVYADRPDAESMLIDAGASYNGYACDITRTYVGQGAGSDRFAALIDGVDALQRATIDEIRLGMNYEALHDICHQKIGNLMVDQQLVRCSGEAAVAEGITRAFFPHGLGHSLGVQVHDVACRKRDPRPENPFLRHTAPISAGQVFTIEPGVYFIDALLAKLKAEPAGQHVDWSAVDRLAPFGGIRIEDNVYVETDGSTRNLTRSAFAAAEA